MRKEDLIKLGLSEEDAKKVAEASKEELEGYVTRERLNEAIEEKKKIAESLEERDKQLDALKDVKPEELKAEIDRLKQDNKEKDEAHKAELTQLKLDVAVEAAITEAGGRNIKAVRALLNEVDLKLGEDGKVVGLKEQLEKLTSDESSAFMFEMKTGGDEKPPIKGFKPTAKGDETKGEAVGSEFISIAEGLAGSFS